MKAEIIPLNRNKHEKGWDLPSMTEAFFTTDPKRAVVVQNFWGCGGFSLEKSEALHLAALIMREFGDAV